MKKPTELSQGVVLTVLSFAERNRVSIGGLFLVALGMYLGQYAKLFPESSRDYAGWFCIAVSIVGLIDIVVRWMRQLFEPAAKMATPKRARSS